VNTGSEGGPHGLYKVTLDGKARCVAPGEYRMHDNITPDGRLAVADTNGKPMEGAPPSDRKTGGRISDIILINPANGRQVFLCRTTITKHPYHAHPHISPDGRWVVFNDSDNRRVEAVELKEAALKEFLQ